MRERLASAGLKVLKRFPSILGACAVMSALYAGILEKEGIHVRVVAGVVPLLRVLEAVPAKVPSFAIGAPLYWKSGSHS